MRGSCLLEGILYLAVGRHQRSPRFSEIMYLLYSIVLALGLLVFSPVLLAKDSQDGRYTRFLRERFGRVAPMTQPGAIWVHAVSVGEALAVERLIATLREEAPDRPVVLSVTTATGRAVAERRIGADRIFYFPLDFTFAVRRTLRAIRPSLVLVVETEIWPNFLREAAAQKVGVVFINGRISGRSYARYRLIRRLLRGTLASAARFLMQTRVDADRIIDLGADTRRVEIAGNLKFDLIPPENHRLLELMQERLRASGIAQVVVAGSTMESEESLVLDAWQVIAESFPASLLILAPRHPQRFDEVAQLLDQRQIPWVRRSRMEARTLLPCRGVLLLDTLGELTSLYKLADVAFVGGSLVPHGGHNILEPAYFGTPTVFGPYMQNFAQIAEQFLEAEAALRADSSIELGRVWAHLLSSRELRTQVGAAAQRLMESKRGATARAIQVIDELLIASDDKKRQESDVLKNGAGQA